MDELSRLIAESVAEWRAGRHYEAHEVLEDVAELFDADDPSFDVAIALVHIAAAFHKVLHNVGPKASPGKIRRALGVLDEAPNQWHGLDLLQFRGETRDVLAALDAGTTPAAFPILRTSTPSEPGSS